MFKASPNATTVVLGTSTNTGFCLKSDSASGKTFYYSSSGGGVTTTACTNS